MIDEIIYYRGKRIDYRLVSGITRWADLDHVLNLRDLLANWSMKIAGIRSPLEFRVLHINGIALHVVLAGPASGKPLMFLHGFPEFWRGAPKLITSPLPDIA